MSHVHCNRHIGVENKCLTAYCLLILIFNNYVGGSVQDCSNSIANALELLQPCTKPSMLYPTITSVFRLFSTKVWSQYNNVFLSISIRPPKLSHDQVLFKMSVINLIG